MKKELLINDVSPNDLNNFLWRIMDQLGERDVKKAVELINSGKVVVENIRIWKEKKDIVSFSVTSDGTEWPQWIKRFESQGIVLDDWIKRKLGSIDFKPTCNITTNLVVFKSEFIRAVFLPQEIEKRKLIIPTLETLCLVREKFSGSQIREMCRLLIVPDGEKDTGFFGLNGFNHDQITGIYHFWSYECDYAGQMFEVPVEIPSE